MSDIQTKLPATAITSISVIDSTPVLAVKLARKGWDGTIVVSGMGISTVADLSWGDIIDIIGKLIDTVGGGGHGNKGGGGGGGDGCTTITVKGADGGSTTVKTCPPPK